MEKNLTQGSVLKNIMYFALPYLLSYFLQQLYGMADLYMIGMFGGVDGTTAVTNGSQVMYMLTVIIVGLAMGATVMIGKAVGGGKLRDAAAAIGNTVTLFMGLSVVITAVLLCVARPVVLLIGTPAEAVEGTVSYLIICFIGIPFIVAYNIISSIFRGMGDSRSPMFFIGVACAVNVILDYVFMGRMQMGPAGAALGTTLAQTVSVVVALFYMKGRKTGISLKRQDFVPRRKVMGELLKVGVPVAVQDGCIQVAFIVITVIANHRGLDDAAAVGVVEKIISALFIIPSSMLATVSALSAQNIGAGKGERAYKTLKYGILITSLYGVLISALVELCAPALVGIFTGDETVIRLGCQYIKGYIWDSIFAGIHFCFSGYFCAYGKSYIGFIHNMASILLVRIPGSYLASVCFAATLFPMGLAAPAGSVLSIVICLTAFWWMKRKGMEENGRVAA